MHGRISLAAVAASLVFAAPAAAALPAGNLVVNPGAEAGSAAADSSTQLPLPGWTVESTFTAVKYGASGFLTVEDGARLGGGTNFFAGGPGGDITAASQTIDVSGAAAEIDAGKASASLSALIGGYATQEDAATVSATPLNSSDIGIAPTTTIGPVTQAERGGTTNLLPRSATFTLPAGTRKLSVRITATRAAGNYNDGYIDNVSLSFAGGTPVAGKSVGAKPVSGTVLVKLPGSSKFVALDPSVIKNGAEVDTRKGVVEITRSDGGVAKFYDGIFKLSQAGGITTLTLSREAHRLPEGQEGERRGEEAEDAQALGRRQGQVPHPRPVQRGHRPRHQVARHGHLHHHDHEGHQGRGHRPRPGQEEEHRRAQGQALHRSPALDEDRDDRQRAVHAVGHLGVDVG